ncbi:hypothetical protein [Candidatus Lokiarchaeum ossiferum]|uniref:hypothetical protein n=1 Tax=Candidatus Lokiarchaeum ossiferum TaxID=2951803 RepID=UPI00352FA3F0
MAEIQNEMLQLGVYALVVRGQGDDLLMGTNVNNYIKVEGLEHLLHFFISDLDKFFSHIYDHDIAGYLNSLEEKFHVDLSTLQENMELNIRGMEDTDSDDVMIYYLVITKTLEQLRQKIFETRGWNWIQEFYKEKAGKAPTKEILNEINRIDSKVDKSISLLYNLIFIYYLAEIYSKKKIQVLCKDLIKTSIKQLSSIIQK